MIGVSFIMHKFFHYLVVASVFLLLIFSGVGCRREAADTSNSNTVIVKSPDPNVVEMDHPERFPLVEAEGRRVADEINVNGVVSPDVNRSVAVLSLTGGRALDVKVRLGDDVKKGQLLFRIHSDDLASAFSDYQKAQADELLSRKQLERTKGLLANGAAAAKDLEAAQDAEDKALVDLKTAADHIKLLGGDPDHLSAILDICSPMSGSIVEQNVTSGTAVRSLDATPNLFTIADMSHVWIVCDVYENDISRVHLGDYADVRLNSFPDRIFKGRVSNISRVLDPNIRSAKIRIEMDNPGLIMRSGMFVTAVIRSPKSVEMPVVPTTAIIRMHDRYVVFQPLGGNRFRETEVQIAPEVSAGFQPIVSGIKIRDKVVVNALQFSDAEEESQ